ncbi:MAG: hypothetical protein PHR28_08995 [candidate division Zixibacteria bacterium]|nr:hypothetical protein [candidate division Zixibacteria bacterium]
MSNSSSTSFIITNKTAQPVNLVEFVIENRHLIDEFNALYNEYHSFENVVESARRRYFVLQPGDTECVFGDADGDLIGEIFDYVLREGGESNRFTWQFNGFLR